ncbi:hypothetical protein [Actinomadura litoris]|uniref:hypothetical protein n=1 Tax=Actinomadura litoris TaxID=2678616 RepID=UPI001FA77CA6|nr:hypothetical protein [Actinomadura litoris]
MNPNPDPARDQNDAVVAVTVMATFQGYVQHAEAKISTLLVAHTGAIVAVMAALPTLPPPGGPSGLMMSALYLTFATAFLLSGHHLIQALRPRPRTPVPPSAFGVFGVSPQFPPDGPAQRDAAWQMVRLFAFLAETKNRHVAKAIPGTAVMLASCLACIAAGQILH